MISDMAARARQASIAMASLTTRQKNTALESIAEGLAHNEGPILEANQADLAQAQADRIAPVLLKRLKFDRAKLRGVIDGIVSLIDLPDPVGVVQSATELDRGLNLTRVSCPIGVLGIVFESRPDALVQISTLALKSANAVLLKGGSEAARTNRVLADIINDAACQAGIPDGWIGLLETREDVSAMLSLDDSIDLIIPRGSNAFVKYIMENTRIPVLGHADGICHVYIDRDADADMAVRVTVDSKCQYPAVCNAAETLLIHRAVAAEQLPGIAQALTEAGVELRGDAACRQIIDCRAADDDDWRTEYNDLILSIAVVDSLEAAIDHINRFGSGHTDSIVTASAEAARQFMDQVDSANVFWNCSTRFADGYRYGLGAEVGISTNKIHARGPVGLDGLVIYKYRLAGQGHIVAEYADGTRQFSHRPLTTDGSAPGTV